MYLLVFDLFVRLTFLTLGIISLKLAWEFGLWRVNGKECIKKNMVRLFVALSWAGFVTFIGGAIKIFFDQWNVTPELDDMRVVTVRFISVAPLIYAVYKFHKYVTCAQNKAYVERMNQDNHANGSAS